MSLSRVFTVDKTATSSNGDGIWPRDKNLVKTFHADGPPKGRVSHEILVAPIPPAHADESAAHCVPAVVLCHHGCGFVAVGAFCVLSWCRRVVSNGGWSAAQVGVGAARVCVRLLSHCLLAPSCSGYPLLIDVVSCSLLLLVFRAEVVDREDIVKQRWVVTVDFGPVFRVPDNIAKWLLQTTGL